MANRLAIDGGIPVRRQVLPYSRQSVNEQDAREIVATLHSDWLTTGPRVREFEQAFARWVGSGEAVAVSSGTAALHAAMHVLGVGPGDEVIVPALTFVASANCVVYQGAIPIFADVDLQTLLIDPQDVQAKITPRTKAIIGVDYAGQPCDYDALREIARMQRNISVVADACHSLGARNGGRSVGTLAELNAFSLHPVKAMTTGEGGVVTAESFEIAHRMRCFRNHGVTSDHFQREQQGSWLYEMVELGHNYRLSDLQCALGLSQLKRLPEWIARRRAIAQRYDEAFQQLVGIRAVETRSGVESAYHLYVVRLDLTCLHADRRNIFAALRAEGIGVNVHYLPVHLHPFYRRRFGLGVGHCPNAEAAYETILSLPLFPAMEDQDVEDVIEAVWKVISAYAAETRPAVVAGSR